MVAGENRVCYGRDEKVIGTRSFKEWVLKQDGYDLSRFVGLLPPAELARLLALSDRWVLFQVACGDVGGRTFGRHAGRCRDRATAVLADLAAVRWDGWFAAIVGRIPVQR